jgi:hypothetical protein
VVRSSVVPNDGSSSPLSVHCHRAKEKKEGDEWRQLVAKRSTCAGAPLPSAKLAACAAVARKRSVRHLPGRGGGDRLSSHTSSTAFINASQPVLATCRGGREGGFVPRAVFAKENAGRRFQEVERRNVTPAASVVRFSPLLTRPPPPSAPIAHDRRGIGIGDRRETP